MALACLICVGILGIAPAQAQVQINPGNDLLNQLVSGQIDVPELTQQLTRTGNIGQLDAQNLVSNIINNPSASLSSLGDVVNGVLTGQMNPQTALGLSSLGQLGNISNIQDFAQVFGNNLIQQGIQSALANSGLSGVAQQFGQILTTGGTANLVNSILTQAGVPAQVANLISAALGPALSAQLGGLAGIETALTQGLGGAVGTQSAQAALAALQASQQQQSQNQKTEAACGDCKDCCNCHKPISQNHKNIRAHMTREFESYRTWLVSTWYTDNMVPALMLMTNQMTTAALQQVEIFGMFLDAKHQLESQRLFQQMTAQAHKDYQPSEGLCEFGTATRSLAASERRADLGQIAFSQRLFNRQIGAGDITSVEGRTSDKASRLDQFLKEYCDKNDNGEGPEGKGGLEVLCKKTIPPERQNKDIDFTRTIDTPLTLDVDFTEASNSDDEKDIFALTSNLYAHDVPEKIIRTKLASSNGDIRPDAFPYYLDLRAITAKRSVAQNSVAAIAAMKSKGSSEVAPFIKKFIEQLGLTPEEINKLIGDEPSYFAQMEILTKKIYEDPKFYADLYDKPVNVERKIAAMEAIGLMQDRDIYKSLLRSEAILATYLETLLTPEQERVSSRLSKLVEAGDNERIEDEGGTAP